jgi:hypothetical protein
VTGELVYDGKIFVWDLFDGLVTVTVPNFRTKATQLGFSPPQVIARLLARALANEEPKNKKF